MSVLHYQLWTQVKAQENFDGRLMEKKASGTIPLSIAVSAAIPIPAMGAQGYRIAAVFKVVGTDRAYIEARASDTLTDKQTSGAHAVTDATPRTLVGAEDGAILEIVPAGGTFTVVQAAAVV